jgi:hydroxymethylpyrimidine kinase/phosphomethylpyrimidine kinase/thiamine-phosphate diphosphorylase
MANESHSHKPAVLLIGGIDPQGCSGISADMLTVQHHGCHALPLVSCLTQQSSAGLSSLGAVDAEQFVNTFKAINADFDIKAVKIGLIPNLEIAQAIKEIVSQLDAVPVVLDPVLTATSGGEAVAVEVSEYVLTELMPTIEVITPNLDELQQLTASELSVEQASEQLLKAGANHCLVKGGHADSAFASDYFASDISNFYSYQPMLAGGNVRGTGCVLASSIASHLACEQDIRDAVILAKAYVNRGIRLAETAGPYQLIHHSREPLQLIDLPKLTYQKHNIGKQFNFKSCPERLGIYPVVDSEDWINKLVTEGVRTIQLRVKDAPADLLDEQVRLATEHTADKDISFFVNDHWPLAIKYQAYGVHLGQEDLHDAELDKIETAGLRLGVSTHSYWELARALAINPSYIALGPIFATTSKQMPFSPQGQDRLQQWVELLADHYPLVAIGGIDLPRAKQLKQTGVGSVAMITAITKAEDYKKATQDLLECWAETDT